MHGLWPGDVHHVVGGWRGEEAHPGVGLGGVQRLLVGQIRQVFHAGLAVHAVEFALGLGGTHGAGQASGQWAADVFDENALVGVQVLLVGHIDHGGFLFQPMVGTNSVAGCCACSQAITCAKLTNIGASAAQPPAR